MLYDNDILNVHRKTFRDLTEIDGNVPGLWAWAYIDSALNSNRLWNVMHVIKLSMWKNFKFIKGCKANKDTHATEKNFVDIQHLRGI